MKKFIKRISILLIILLLFALLNKLGSLNGDIDVLVKRQLQQQQKIEQLEASNARLENVVVYQHQQLQEFRNEPATVQTIEKTIYIDNKTKEVEKVEANSSWLTTTIATLMVAGKSLVSLKPILQ
jgi:Na+-translocating ferredoxin:NAD+ oxidoreductase RnfG subunit